MGRGERAGGGGNSRKRTDTYIINANRFHICNNSNVLYSAVGVFEFQVVTNRWLWIIFFMMEDGKFTSLISNVFFLFFYFLLYNMEGGRSGYTSLLKRSSRFCRLFRIMKSPGSSCAAAIVMFDHLTSKVRARIFSFVFPSRSLKAGIKSLPKNCSGGPCCYI